ncbi:MAG: 1-deoxy-D-xylulose-5-phosphate reductoisomerase [Ignavibacteria bacterium]|nr:1-deoxy-D-xylulose-5-phosphate reductoisomerase [Ignavibacteria bacterium]
MKTLAIFGSTGSIGTSTLDVVRQHPGRFRVRYLTAHRNAALLCAQAREFAPDAVAVVDPASAREAREILGSSVDVLSGMDGLLELARREDYDTLVSSLVGFAGMLPTIAAIQSGHDIALANKETLVVAGEIISRLLERHGVALAPVDSEHSAIWQCLAGEPPHSVAKLILTASGGPFRGRSREDLADVTREEALRHPNWTMGSKITIDSATLMNKGLEVIEAHWLFRVPPERIEVIVHPQSIIHSMVEFADGSVKAQLGLPDMKLPIQYALSHPDRFAVPGPRLDLLELRRLTFEEPDLETFRCLALAYEALAAGGTAPACLNAANEIAVQAFLDGRIGFLDIARVIEESLAAIPAVDAADIESIIATDAETRIFATSCAARSARTVSFS